MFSQKRHYIDIMRKNNREKILETARQLFPKYGYNGISIRAIASKARLTTGAIYFHFKNKKEIYKTICFEAIDILINKFRTGIGEKKTPLQKLISTFDSYMHFFYKHRDHYNILMEFKAAYDSDKNATMDEIAQKMNELTDMMADSIEVCIEEGYYRRIDPKMLSFLLASVAEGMLQYKKLGLMDAMGISDRDFKKIMLDAIGKGVLIKK